MTQERYPLIFLKNANENHAYTSPQSGGGKPHLSQRNRRSHGQRIQKQLEEAWKEFQNIKNDRTAVSLTTRNGKYLEVKQDLI